MTTTTTTAFFFSSKNGGVRVPDEILSDVPPDFGHFDRTQSVVPFELQRRHTGHERSRD
jgi:hypothetical protein